MPSKQNAPISPYSEASASSGRVVKQRAAYTPISLPDALKQMRALLSNLSCFATLKDADGRYLYANPKACDFFGQEIDSFIGKNDNDLWPEETAQLFNANDRWVLEQGLPLETEEFDQVRGRFFAAQRNPLFDDKGEVVGICTIAFDITTHKQTEEALNQSRHQLAAFIKQAPVGIAMFDRNMNYLAVSDIWQREFGSGDGIIGRNHYEVLTDLPEDWKSIHQACLNGAYLAHDDYCWERDDGSRYWLRRAVSPWLDYTGEIGGIIISIENITERKLAEERLHRREKQLRFITDHAPVYIAQCTKDKCYKFVNQPYANLFGLEVSELVGKPMLEILRADAYSFALPFINAVLSGQETAYDFTLPTTMAYTSVFHAHFLPEYDAEGKVVGFVSAITDITERKEAERQLRIAATAFESREGMIITDANTIILQVNQSFTEITGYLAEEVVGKTPHLLSSGFHDSVFYEQMWAEIKHQGQWQGEIWNRRKNNEAYPELITITAVKNEQGKITNYVATFSDISEIKYSKDKIEQLAYYDQLTQLPNRTLLHDRLKQAFASSARSGLHGAVFFIDLDNFKMLNDTLGHAVGDLLLQQVAQRLTASVREGDTVARLGGDEFVIILENLNASFAEAAAQSEGIGGKILASLREPYNLSDKEYAGTPSIGFALFKDHSISVENLLKQADIAMYQAKASGRNTLRFFDEDMQRIVTRRVALEHDLNEAIPKNQFFLHYQPQVDSSGRIVGAETLVRWQHPLRGLVPPSEFIPLAEETGLISAIGYWVLEAACQQLAIWANKPATQHLNLAVNVSAYQFRMEDFVKQVLTLLEQTGAKPNLLKLELTESLLVENVEDVIRKMSALQSVGVSFSLDDFGTGYSSLIYLKTLPISQLKIDRGFVNDLLTDPNDAAIARTIIALAQIMGLSVIAEGVETHEQRDFLVSHGCNFFQGYLFSKPVSIEVFESVLDQVFI